MIRVPEQEVAPPAFHGRLISVTTPLLPWAPWVCMCSGSLGICRTDFFFFGRTCKVCISIQINLQEQRLEAQFPQKAKTYHSQTHRPTRELLTRAAPQKQRKGEGASLLGKQSLRSSTECGLREISAVSGCDGGAERRNFPSPYSLQLGTHHHSGSQD